MAVAAILNFTKCYLGPNDPHMANVNLHTKFHTNILHVYRDMADLALVNCPDQGTVGLVCLMVNCAFD